MHKSRHRNIKVIKFVNTCWEHNCEFMWELSISSTTSENAFSKPTGLSHDRLWSNSDRNQTDSSRQLLLLHYRCPQLQCRWPGYLLGELGWKRKKMPIKKHISHLSFDVERDWSGWLIVAPHCYCSSILLSLIYWSSSFDTTTQLNQACSA